MTTLKDKTALVTGGSRGIGKAIALSLAREGVRVGINYHSHAQDADSVCQQLESLGVECMALQADVADEAAVSGMIREIEAKWGGVDILVNNAGIVHKDALENITGKDWDRILNINLKSAFMLTQACIGHMRRRQWGRIINISSVAAQTGGVTSPLYVASKAGMIGLTHSYAALLVKEGITANAVTPALIETDMLTKDLQLSSPDKIPVGRFGKVEEVAEVVLMLAKNAYITGQTINVNGGWYFSS